jgi:hypothetical protein
MNIQSEKVIVSPDHRFLMRASGAPFYWFGDTAWELFHRLSREEAELYLQTRSQQGFTVIQAVILAELDGVRTPNAYGHCPLLDEDPTRLNEAYFEHVDWIVRRGNELGLTFGLLPTWADKVGKTNGAGPSIFNPENAARYGVLLGKRYESADLVWILGGDRAVDDQQKRTIWIALADGLREGDRRAHLITFHPNGSSSSSAAFPNSDPLLDFNLRQNGHGIGTGSDLRIRSDYDGLPTKPVIDGEPIYEDHPIAFDAANQGYSTAYDCRVYLYWDLFSGAFGHTYGHHTIWQFHEDKHGEGINKPVGTWPEAMRCPGADQIRHAKALLKSRPFCGREPADNVLIPSRVPNAMPGSGTRRIVASRANDGSYLWVYSPVSRRYEINLSTLSGDKMHVWWYNPRTGRAADAGIVPRSAHWSICPPERGEHQDWIFAVDDARCDFGPPGSGEMEPVRPSAEVKAL